MHPPKFYVRIILLCILCLGIAQAYVGLAWDNDVLIGSCMATNVLGISGSLAYIYLRRRFPAFAELIDKGLPVKSEE